MPTLRHKLAALVGALAMFSTVFLFAGVAGAQTGYPPGTTVPGCTVSNVNQGVVPVGQTVTFKLCGNFAAGGAVSVTVNGITVTTSKSPSGGFVVVVVTVVSTSTLQVNDPTNVATICGTNTVIATGPALGGGTGTSTGTFTVLCTSSSTSNGLALTGANVMAAILIALALIVIGTLLVLFQRRRRQTV